MPQNKHVFVKADTDSTQLTRVPNKSPNPPFISLNNVEMEIEDGKKEKVDLVIILSADLLGNIVRESIRELKELQESVEV